MSMVNMKPLSLLTLAGVMVLLSACATKVSRLDIEESRDLSGYWNDTDSRKVASDIIEQAIRMSWLSRFELKHGGKQPSIVVGGIQNKTDEHINTDTFIGDIERSIINSGKMAVIASSNYKDKIRKERSEQDIFASLDTRKAMGQEIGSDVIMLGVLSSINDSEGRQSIRFYQLDVRIIDVETNRILWSGVSKIKKYVSGKLFRS